MASLIKDFKEHRLKENFEKEFIPETPGIYALYLGDVVVYVGRSENLKSRIHLRTKSETKIWDRFSWYEVTNEEHYKEMEGLLINVARPRYNKSHAKNKSLGIIKKITIILFSIILIHHTSYAQVQTVSYRIDSMSYSNGDTIKRKTPFTKIIFTISKHKYITDITFMSNTIKKELKANDAIPKPPPPDCYDCFQENSWIGEESDSIKLDDKGYHIVGYNGLFNTWYPILGGNEGAESFTDISIVIPDEDFENCYSEHLILNKDFYLSRH